MHDVDKIRLLLGVLERRLTRGCGFVETNDDDSILAWQALMTEPLGMSLQSRSLKSAPSHGSIHFMSAGLF